VSGRAKGWAVVMAPLMALFVLGVAAQSRSWADVLTVAAFVGGLALLGRGRTGRGGGCPSWPSCAGRACRSAPSRPSWGGRGIKTRQEWPHWSATQVRRVLARAAAATPAAPSGAPRPAAGYD
jgi:hypothetical protein